MNILYIGHYRENNNLGYSSIRYIQAIKSIPNINLSIRPIYLQNKFLNKISDDISILETNHSKYYDMVIQHTLPEFYIYDKRFGKNIGIAKIETENIYHTGWIEKINLMDEIWVGSYFSYMILRNCGVIKKIKVIPEPYDIEQFTANKTKHKKFTFYSITSSDDKDNIKKIILSYLLEFNNSDCKLILKLTKSSDNKNIQKIINNCYTIARLNPNKTHNPIIIPDYISLDQMVDFHTNNYCYIDLQKASSIGSSSIEALLCGNSVITINKSASSSFVNNNNGIIISGQKQKIYTKPTYNISTIFTDNEYWYDFDIDEARLAMRRIYENRISPKIDRYLFDKNKFKQHIL